MPECVKHALFYKNMDAKRLRAIVDLAEDQHYIREMLPQMGPLRFRGERECAAQRVGDLTAADEGRSEVPVTERAGSGNGSSAQRKDHRYGHPQGNHTDRGRRLPRQIHSAKGAENWGYMTISRETAERYVITDNTAVKLRAEDGRSIQKTDISMFINDLPNGKDTVGFCTEDASGSTSQAANVVESIEAGTSLLLIDEDTSATNFMIRDELMQRVIHRDMEPITPFIERIRELYDDYGISTVIVAGSSGAYFHVADTIIQMDRYVPKDITAYAKKAAESYPAVSGPEAPAKKTGFPAVSAGGKRIPGE